MIEILIISVVVLILAAMTYVLINKWLQIVTLENERKHALNTKSAEAEISAAVEKGLKEFDDRINNTWGTIGEVKQELNALKLQIGLKGMNNGR